MVLDDYTASINVLLRKAHTLSVYDRVNYNTVILVFKCIHNGVPVYLQDMFSFRNLNAYNLRNNELCLNVPYPRTSHFKQSFSYVGAITWNSLPVTIKSSQTIDQFKLACKHTYACNENVLLGYT